MSAYAAIIGTSTVIRHVQHLVLKVAELDTPVMVTGEPGAGKEIVARAIHEKSQRANGLFIPVKCAAIAEDLLEAELFGMARAEGGHRSGRFEMANGGTIFLDEISKVSLRVQGALARFLNEGVIVPVGAHEAIPVNARLICGSIHPLDELVRDRLVREEIYYCLASCSVYIPPLRERREDIPLVVDYFIEKYNQQKGKNIFSASADAMTALLQHGWANNMRELENLIERIVVLKNTGSIEVCDLPPRIRDLVTSNIDSFYERAPAGTREPQRTVGNSQSRPSVNSYHQQGGYHAPSSSHSNASEMPTHPSSQGKPSTTSASSNFTHNIPNTGFVPPQAPARAPSYDESSDIDQFIKKEIDLGNGIDFYRVVEEFENRLIAEALRRTNHNKNRAAQLLSMNRTTLVEKLKKRTSSTQAKGDNQRVKRNSAYTIFDSLGGDEALFGSVDFMTKEDTDRTTDPE